MTKVRDIANFLGKTEAFNTTNKTLAFDSNDVTTLTPSVATDIISANGLVVYDSVGLLPASPNDGDRAWVTSNNRFYVADSSWHNSLLINNPPTINILNYDSDLNDSQSLSMTIQPTDSFENLDIITYNAVISPSNILDSAVLSFTFDSSVVDMAMRSNTIDGVRNFQVTFTANDQVNISTSVKDFTVSPSFSTGTLVSSVSAVNEGSSVLFTLPTVGYANGATFPYTITGISAADLSPASLTGNMVVSGSSATKTITALADTTTEGAETMTFSADGQSVNVTVNDTSLSPPTYSISLSNAGGIGEGGIQYIYIVYANHAGGTISCSFTPTSGVGDIYDAGHVTNCTMTNKNYSAGTFDLALTGQSGTATLYVRHANDNSRNGTGTARVVFGSPISANTGYWTINDTDWPYCGMLGPTGSYPTSGVDNFTFRFHRDGISGYQYGEVNEFRYGSNNTGGLQNGGTTGLHNSNRRYYKTIVFKLGSTDVGYFTWNDPQNIYFGTNSVGLVTNTILYNANQFGNAHNGGFSTDLGNVSNSSDVYGGTNSASIFFDTLAFHSSTYSGAAGYNKYNEFYLFDAV